MLHGRLTPCRQDYNSAENNGINGQHDSSVGLKNSYEIGGSSGLSQVVDTDSVIDPGSRQINCGSGGWVCMAFRIQNRPKK